MSLKLRLKPHEKLLIGHAVVRNGENASTMYVENNIPILREKDIMKEEAATTPEQRLYFLIQLMYVDQNDLPRYLTLFREQIVSIQGVTADLDAKLAELIPLVENCDYYNALKTARQIMQ